MKKAMMDEQSWVQAHSDLVWHRYPYGHFQAAVCGQPPIPGSPYCHAVQPSYAEARVCPICALSDPAYVGCIEADNVGGTGCAYILNGAAQLPDSGPESYRIEFAAQLTRSAGMQMVEELQSQYPVPADWHVLDNFALVLYLSDEIARLRDRVQQLEHSSMLTKRFGPIEK